MAAENHDELLWPIDEESAELDNLTKQREELEKDVAQMQNEYKDELKKKLQAIKDNKNKENKKINKNLADPGISKMNYWISLYFHIKFQQCNLLHVQPKNFKTKQNKLFYLCVELGTHKRYSKYHINKYHNRL